MRSSITLFLAIAASLVSAQEWQNLFNGSDLRGWGSDPELGHWSVQNGVIVGQSDPEQKGSILWTKEHFGDFVAETEFRFNGVVDSGFFLKTWDYQVNLGHSTSLKVDRTGCIYAPIDKKGPYPGMAKDVDKVFRNGDWNHLRVECRGKTIVVHLNGAHILTYETTALPESGPIGIQVHAGHDMRIEFRNLRIRETGTN